MPKREHNWAKGYEQRQQDKQRELTRAQKIEELRERKAMKKKHKGALRKQHQRSWENQQDIHNLELQVAKYKKVWEAEKEINQAHQAQINGMVRELSQEQSKAFRRGIMTGSVATLLIVLVFVVKFL
ncbi:hypothetical protein [Paenibacillus agilis]|uniref:Uncharacterized protein n=1 Tax=Paenibacillus agilis TaxID=3020863 RepID=A0A559IXD8_9BACL|nr:hypothetical protein [Paenibacillus agilis]TVX92266.1 hypothetical protein FPZ44_03825 [Paenibacillus agilis]